MPPRQSLDICLFNTVELTSVSRDNEFPMKKGKEILGVRSSVLHARVKAYVEAAHSEEVTISSVVRDAIREKIERLESTLGGRRPAPLAGQSTPAHENLISEAAQIHKGLLAKEADPTFRSNRAARKRTPSAQ
jgi:hypothetical protein